MNVMNVVKLFMWFFLGLMYYVCGFGLGCYSVCLVGCEGCVIMVYLCIMRSYCD